MSIYMRYTRVSGVPVKGLVNTAPHEGWIRLEDVQPVVQQLGTAALGKSRPKITEITVAKREDAASNDLWVDAVVGVRAKIVIDFVNRDKKREVTYLTLKLEDAVIIIIRPSGVVGVVETLTFSGKIAIHRWGPGPDADRWWSLS